MIYNGLFRNGKRDGYGRTTDSDGRLVYEGHFVNDVAGTHVGRVDEYGRRMGPGRVTYADGTSFEGEFVGDIENGKGKCMAVYSITMMTMVVMVMVAMVMVVMVVVVVVVMSILT